MFSTLLTGLIGNGLKDLAGKLFETAVDKGEDIAIKKINELTGLSLESGKAPTKKEIDTLKNKEADIENMLDEVMEDNRHTEKMSAIALEEYELETAEIANAREMDKVRLTKGRNFIERNWTNIFAVIGGLIIFSLIYLIIFGDIPKSGLKYADIVLGSLLSMITGVFGYYFGHTKSSGAKSEFIHKELQQKMFEDNFLDTERDYDKK